MEKGWILGPKETPEAFFTRKRLLDEVLLPKEKNLSLPLYDLHGMEAFILHSNESLLPWQGAVLWEYEEEGKTYPVIQIRKSVSKLFSRMYPKEELLAHELVHAARFSFKEPLFEEIFAYQTSSSPLRRFFGPLFLYPFESILFAAFCFVAPMISLFLDSFLGVWLLVSLAVCFLGRLAVLHLLFVLCKQKLEKAGVFSDSCLAVMIRLSDREMIQTALRSPQKTAEYFKEGDRLKEIVKIYFKSSPSQKP